MDACNPNDPPPPLSMNYEVRRVLRYLDRAKSTYTAPFGKLCKAMFLARSKAKSNHKFLRTLKPWYGWRRP